MNIGGISDNSYFRASNAQGPRRPNGPDAAQLASKLLDLADTDGNGGINQAEFSSLIPSGQSSSATSSDQVSSLFSQLDADGDSSLSSQETQVAIESLLHQMRLQGNPALSQPPPPPPPVNADGPEEAAELLARADTDGDTSLDATEFSGALSGASSSNSDNQATRIQSMFTDADTDSDGHLTAIELEAARTQTPATSTTETSGRQAGTAPSLMNALARLYSSSSETTASTLSLSA